MKTISLSEQLGIMVGNSVVDNYLPTLSTDMITLNENRVIQVSDELSEVWKMKHEAWFKLCFPKNSDKEKSDKLFYENRAWYKENIENVYLKPELKILIRDLDTIGDKEEFLRGVNLALWDCDASHYGATDIQLTIGKYNRCYHLILKKDAEVFGDILN